MMPMVGDGSIHSYFEVERTPAGEAPLEIREKWIGLLLPVRFLRVAKRRASADVSVVLITPADYYDGVLVGTRDAIDALDAAGHSGAAAYWEVTLGASSGPGLLFHGSEGRLIPAEDARRLHPELDDSE